VSTSSFQAQEIKSLAGARYYSRHGTSFAASAAPRIRGFYESYRDRADRSLLTCAADKAPSPSISWSMATG
jgi:hypothetical protein